MKIRRPPEAHTTSQPKAGRWRGWAKRDPRKVLNITVQYRGGAEGWIEVKGRGGSGRYPGYTTIGEIVADLNQSH